MKPTTINVQITKNPKQYEAVRLGLEASIDAGETVESAIKAATAQLNAIYKEMYQTEPKVPQNAEKATTNGNQSETAETTETIKRETLTFGDPRVQQIIRRIESVAGNAEMLADVKRNINKFYEPDADAQKAINLAFELNY